MVDKSSRFNKVLKSAARLQEIVPDLVLVGGTAAALYADHRESTDHDHVLVDLESRYHSILEAVEASEGWATSVRASNPPVTLLGSLDGIQAGIRQLRRIRPLEVEIHTLPDGSALRVPSLAEILRIKSYLVVDRGGVRDFLDVAALADRIGVNQAGTVLRDIDSYYADRSDTSGSVATELALALADPQPKDPKVITQLDRYKGLDEKWHSWPRVEQICRQLALEMTRG